MKDLKSLSKEYLQSLNERSVQSRVYQPHQLTGLALSGILEDPKYKSLYMRLAKTYNNDELLRLAKNVAERKDITKKGAYFMKLLKSTNIPKISKS